MFVIAGLTNMLTFNALLLLKTEDEQMNKLGFLTMQILCQNRRPSRSKIFFQKLIALHYQFTRFDRRKNQIDSKSKSIVRPLCYRIYP